MARGVLLTGSLAVLAGCGGGGGSGSIDLGSLARVSLGLTGAALTQMEAALDRVFINALSDFSSTRLALVRNEAAFRANVLNVPGFGTVRPLQASRLDWVRSIDRETNGAVDGVPDVPDGLPDLTGAGIVLGMVDSPILSSHEQFATQAGKFLAGGGGVNEAGDEHGTFVASIMAGTGGAGGTAPTLGYAPEAQIYAGQISYQAGAVLDYGALTGVMDGARAAGAVAMNNSWTLTTAGGQAATVANSSIAGMGAGFAGYVDALERFSQTGVVVFAQFNDDLASASLMAGLPVERPELEQGWLAVINVLANYNPTTDRIVAVQRQSAGCQEAARWCLAATGYITGADIDSNSDYVVGQGTSYAAPQVTGALGLLAQAFPTLTPAQLRNRLIATADNSFFTPEAFLQIVPGVEHGFSTEFGHGFINVRDALMPIGSSAAFTAAGTVVPMDQLRLSGGMLAGDALAAGLAGVQIGFNDQLSASFAAPMAAYVAPVAVAAPARAARRWALDAAGTGAEALALAAPDGAEVNGLTAVDLFGAEGGLRVAALTDGGQGAAGLRVERVMALGAGEVTAGVAAMAGQEGLFGLDFGGGGAAQAVSASLGWRQPMGGGLELALAAEMGRVDAAAGGLVSGLSGLGYNRAGAALARRSVLQGGDRLSVFVQMPVGAVSGTARMDVPQPMAAGAVAQAQPDFAAVDLSLVPEARQVDLGVEYYLPTSQRSDLVLGFAHQRNAGHVAGQTDQVAMMGWRLQF